MHTRIIGHRGYPELYPENTLVSFQHAIEAGAEGIEFDVHESKDRRLVIHHDYYLGHTDNGEGFIFESDWDYLSSLDAGSWFSEEFAGARIPLLEEVFGEFGDKIEYEIELKGMSETLIGTVIETVNDFRLMEKVEFTSPSPILLARLADLCGDVQRGLFLKPFPEWMGIKLGHRLSYSELKLGGFQVAHCPLNILDARFVNHLQESGIRVHASNCNEESELSKAFELGVDQLTTDRVGLALQIRE
jgi:glycerophosphoryl diester phosphodiesterase